MVFSFPTVPAYAPFIFDPVKSGDAITKMLVPQMELPALDKNLDLLKTLDGILPP